MSLLIDKFIPAKYIYAMIYFFIVLKFLFFYFLVTAASSEVDKVGNTFLQVNYKNIYVKKSLMVPKGKTEAVNRKRTDKTVAKKTINDPQNITRNT